jgi:hypothetical protein
MAVEHREDLRFAGLMEAGLDVRTCVNAGSLSQQCVLDPACA